jgi:DNA (cytosine-5)-methyltransferase 1
LASESHEGEPAHGRPDAGIACTSRPGRTASPAGSMLTADQKSGELARVRVRAGGLSVFSGLGGLDLGARIAGLEIELATDQDAEALSMLAAAGGIATLAGNIDEVLAGPLIRLWGNRGSPRCLIGGPPCTPFSHAGFWLEDKRTGKDPAGSMLTSYLRCLEVFEPDAFVLENVPGLAFKTHERFLQHLIGSAHGLGYQVTREILRASDFGVAQARRRLFIVGVRSKSPVSLSSWPSWPIRTSRWAIGALEEGTEPEPDEELREKYRELLPLVPAGGNYLHFTDHNGHDPPLFKYRGRYWSFLLKLDPEKPAPTVPAQRITYNGPFHWRNRHLRVREIARLQSFPDWYSVSSDLSIARRHLGNAVPPLLAAAVVWRVRQALGDVGTDTWPVALDEAAKVHASFEEVTAAYPRPSEKKAEARESGRASIGSPPGSSS